MNPLSATSWLSSLGAAGVFLVLFAETGLLIGFFLPGDSLLFTAGLFCTTSATAAVHLSLPLVLIASVAGALLGAQTGFLIGRRGGRALLARTRNQHLHRGLTRAEELFGRYGHAKAIVLARFIPVVRTVLNPLAKILAVPARTFAVWQVLGGLLWSIGITLALLRPRVQHPRDRPVPAADHRARCDRVAHSARPRTPPEPQTARRGQRLLAIH